MRERPILFSGAMVRAILDGSKTQTRRAIKPSRRLPIDFRGGGPRGGPDWNDPSCWGWETGDGEECALAAAPDVDHVIPCPYGQPGDRLYVRETWAQPTTLDPGPTFYRADYPDNVLGKYENLPPAEAITWKPSIHMPRALSRIPLEITSVRVERLNDCSEADAIAEGIERDGDGWLSYAGGSCVGFPTTSYASLWDSINGAGAWEANPWVWVVEFRRIEL